MVVLGSSCCFAEEVRDTTCNDSTYPFGYFSCDTLLKVKSERSKILKLLPKFTDCQIFYGPFPETIGINFYELYNGYNLVEFECCLTNYYWNKVYFLTKDIKDTKTWKILTFIEVSRDGKYISKKETIYLSKSDYHSKAKIVSSVDEFVRGYSGKETDYSIDTMGAKLLYCESYNCDSTHKCLNDTLFINGKFKY
jgi:hypothetical protein